MVSGTVIINEVSTLTLLRSQEKQEVIFLSCHSVNIVDFSSIELYFNETLTKWLYLLTGRILVKSVIIMIK